MKLIYRNSKHGLIQMKIIIRKKQRKTNEEAFGSNNANKNIDDLIQWQNTHNKNEQILARNYSLPF